MSATGNDVEQAPQERANPDKRRRTRSIVIALTLAGLVVLFYLVTLVKLGPRVLDRAL